MKTVPVGLKVKGTVKAGQLIGALNPAFGNASTNN